MGLCCAPCPHSLPCEVTVFPSRSAIRNVDGTVSIIPEGDAKTYVNGKRVLEPTVLHHVSWLRREGDRLGPALLPFGFEWEEPLPCHSLTTLCAETEAV